MQRFIKVKSEIIFPVIKDILNNGSNVRIMVTGMSMYPFLRENIDSVELSSAKLSDIRRGDIVMVRADYNKYIMHRIIKMEGNCFYIAGDAQQSIEGPYNYNQVFAKITAVWRKDKRIDCINMWWTFLSLLWMTLLPFRRVIIKSYKSLHM